MICITNSPYLLVQVNEHSGQVNSGWEPYVLMIPLLVDTALDHQLQLWVFMLYLVISASIRPMVGKFRFWLKLVFYQMYNYVCCCCSKTQYIQLNKKFVPHNLNQSLLIPFFFYGIQLIRCQCWEITSHMPLRYYKIYRIVHSYFTEKKNTTKLHLVWKT